MLMGWSGDAKQIVTQITGQRHTEDRKFPEKFSKFRKDLKARTLACLSGTQRELFQARLTGSLEWQKYDPKTEKYSARTPMNSYDVLKCSQACFHLFEWLRSLLPEEDRPPRYVESDMEAYQQKESDARGAQL
ncbi:unnamed protein product [Symbiodinium pilosum]|uniref:Uncharacterized protein n=1 Tax=Symbiodinium pilosum TaxID=2952 RepID=A0A812VN04_SYMPI|nr:unnamed protein product [Symbiodinium pilosum]